MGVVSSRIRGTFVSEPIDVDPRTVGAGALTAGGPACPATFVWRGKEYQVVKVLEHGRRLSPDGYVRQHRFRIETAEGLVAVIACDRHVRRGANPWQILAIEKV